MSLSLFVDDEARAHDPGPGMPDRPQRIDACLEALSLEDMDVQVVRAPEPASRRQLQRVHDAAYLDRLEAFCAKGGGWIDADTAAGPRSFEVAARAAGALCAAVDRAFSGDSKAFCLVRPPGHHATRDTAMGFCLLNNVAAGAAHALEAGARRVMVLDTDVHHGNGTQEIFWSEASVLYVSLHQWPWYPWTTGSLEETGGEGAGGANVNVPLPEGCGDDVYLAALEQIVVPIARRFRPDLLMVSAGFDAHAADHLSLQRVTSAGFGRMAATIDALAGELCGGRLVAALEGGYNLGALAESFVHTVRAMAGGPGAANRRPPAAADTIDVLAPIIAFHAKNWVF